jgi:hypothetical protein
MLGSEDDKGAEKSYQAWLEETSGVRICSADSGGRRRLQRKETGVNLDEEWMAKKKEQEELNHGAMTIQSMLRVQQRKRQEATQRRKKIGEAREATISALSPLYRHSIAPLSPPTPYLPSTSALPPLYLPRRARRSRDCMAS